MPPIPDYSRDPAELNGVEIAIIDGVAIKFGPAELHSAKADKPDLQRIAIGRLDYPSWSSGRRQVQYVYLTAESDIPRDVSIDLLRQRLRLVVEDQLNGFFYTTNFVDEPGNIYRRAKFDDYLDEYYEHLSILSARPTLKSVGTIYYSVETMNPDMVLMDVSAGSPTSIRLVWLTRKGTPKFDEVFTEQERAKYRIHRSFDERCYSDTWFYRFSPRRQLLPLKNRDGFLVVYQHLGAKEIDGRHVSDYMNTHLVKEGIQVVSFASLANDYEMLSFSVGCSTTLGQLLCGLALGGPTALSPQQLRELITAAESEPDDRPKRSWWRRLINW